MWQFLCGREHGADDAGVVALQQTFESDPSAGVLSEMPMMGASAAKGGPYYTKTPATGEVSCGKI